MIKILQILAVNLPLVLDTSGNTVNAKQIEITARSGDIQATQTDFTSRGENGERLQDSQRSNSNSIGLGSKVEFGFGTAWEFSGNASATSGKANSKQVTEQSGLFAGEGGYHINANNVHLEGGAIASTNPSQSELSTNSLTFNDIQNESGYRATSAAISGGYSNSDGISGSPTLPMHEQGNDNSITKATLTEGNITLNKDSQPTQTTAKALGINTELKNVNEKVEAPKDIAKVLKEQQILSQAAGNVASAVMTYASQQAAELEAKAKQAEQEAAKAAKEGDLVTATQKAQEAAAYQQAATEWQTGGDKKQAATSVATALSLIVAGKPTEAVVAGVASPYVNEAIKKATASPELQALNIPAHILWGAVEAQLSGSSAIAGAVAAGVGEAGAKILSETIYGKSPADLTETEKQELIQVIKGIAGVAGGVVAGSDTAADSLATVSTGMRVAENAVEFNGLLDTQVSHLFKDLEKAEKEGKSLEEIFTEYKQLSDKQFKDIQENCNSATCLYGIEKLNEEANQKALELVSFFNSKLSTLSDSTQERFVEFVIEENAKELDFINGARTPAEKAIVFLVDAFVESRESQGLNVSPKIAGFAKKNNKKVISTNEKPNNLSPIGAGRQGAFNEAKRQSGIPTSQQPSNVYPNVDKRGNRQPGLMYEFEIPQPGGGIKKVIIRDDAKGHFYGEGDIQNRGPHFNDPKGNHYDY